MNKMNFIPAFYGLGPVCLLLLFFLNGCAVFPTEIRYDQKTRTYSSPQDGVKYRVDQYESATAHYTLIQGGPPVPKSEVIKARPVQQVEAQKTGETKTVAEKQEVPLPMVIEVTDVLFEFDKWVIKEPFLPELDRWVTYFKDNPQVTAHIYGHTDSTGPATYNQKLSEKRAQAVINYLIEKGIKPGRLTAKGFGESQPAVQNDTQEGRQKNRRVEVSF